MIGMPLTNKNAIVTGSIGGLGHAIARELALAGANVMLHGIEDADAAMRVKDELSREVKSKILLSRADLTSVGQIGVMFDEAVRGLGSVDIVVNNAVVRHFSSVEHLTVEQWDEALAVNLSSALHFARLAIPGMKARKWGRIINMSSIYGSRAVENRVGYVTTKTALIGMTRAIALETARDGITCNAICPGTVPTAAITSKLAGMAATQDRDVHEVTREYLQERQPTAKFVEMDDVAALVLFLCGPHSSSITGSVLPVDGGWAAK